MPRNGSGTFTVYTPGNPVVTGAVISSTAFNATMTDFATGLTNSIAKDGQTTPTANLPMGTYKHTGVAVGSALTDYARYDQVQNSAPQWLTSVSGTDTITASATVAPSAYAAGQTFRFVPAGANTTAAVTLNVNSLGAKNVYWGASALPAGAIGASTVVEVTYDGTQFQVTGMQAVGTSAGNLVRLDSSGKLPAVDGSQLTGIGATQIQPISASVGSNALTISASALSLDFRSTTLGSGTVSHVSGTPSNLVISSGSTLGTVNAVQSRIAVLALNNSGTIELAAVNVAGGVDLTETGLISTTAEGGAGAADSASVVYSTTARTSLAYRVIGYIESTQATAGTWATAPSTIQGVGGQAWAAMASLGYGQTWQDVKTSPGRSTGTTYYNTTGKPIVVSLICSAVSNTSVTVNGNLLGYLNTGALQHFIVPPGGSYVISAAGTTVTNWWELR